jgi:hypothetical protein
MAQHYSLKFLDLSLLVKRSITFTLTGALGLMVVTSLGCSAVQSDPLTEAQDNSETVQAPDSVPPRDATAMPSTSPGQQLPISAIAEIAGQEILLEVARTPRQQALGLMFRDPLPDNQGMLFPLGRPRPVNFWMKNVPVPLDMVFISNGTIKAIEANVPPCESNPCPTYGPGSQLIDHVIELRGGHAAELGLAVGDTVVIFPVNP